jgi:hypothetical protein
MMRIDARVGLGVHGEGLALLVFGFVRTQFDRVTALGRLLKGEHRNLSNIAKEEQW